MHVCDVFGQGRAHAPDNKIISVCDKTLAHPGGSRRPVHRKPLSTAAVCAARDQTLASSQSSVAPHANHSDNSPCTGRPMGNSIIERHGLRHVVGCLLHGLLWVHEGRRIFSHPCLRILPSILLMFGGHSSGPSPGSPCSAGAVKAK